MRFLIFWISVIVVFYKNKILFAMPDGLKGLILLAILGNIRLDLQQICNKTSAHLYEINYLT